LIVFSSLNGFKEGGEEQHGFNEVLEKGYAWEKLFQ